MRTVWTGEHMRSVDLKRLGVPWRINVGRIKNAFSPLLQVFCSTHLLFISSKNELNPF